MYTGQNDDHSYESTISTLTKPVQNDYNSFAVHRVVDGTLIENHAASMVMQENKQEIAAFTAIQQTG